MALPERLIIHVSGIPATGKSTFCRFLAQNHRFAHYDIECFPHGWPQTELWDSWLQNPREFVEELGRHHHRSAIDWGFPVQARSRVAKMKASGVILIWFAGSVRVPRGRSSLNGANLTLQSSISRWPRFGQLVSHVALGRES